MEMQHQEVRESLNMIRNCFRLILGFIILTSCSNRLILSNNSFKECEILEKKIRVLGELKLRVEIDNCFFNKKSKTLSINGKIFDVLSNHPLSNVVIINKRKEAIDTLYVTNIDGGFNFISKINNKDESLLFFNLVGFESKNYNLNCLTEK